MIEYEAGPPTGEGCDCKGGPGTPFERGPRLLAITSATVVTGLL